MTEFWLLLAPTEPTECSVLSENLYVVGPRLYTTAGLSDRTPAWVLHIIEYTAPTPLLHLQPLQEQGNEFLSPPVPKCSALFLVPGLCCSGRVPRRAQAVFR